jgi:hypothetical protein
MAKAKKKKSSAKPAAPKTAARKAPSKPGDIRGRKLGERVETITETLSPRQIEEARTKVCDLTRSRNTLDEKRKASASEFNARLKELDAMIDEELDAAASGRRDVEVTIEEYLTPQNQVIRYRTDTGELLGDRAARAEDLQELLPLGDDPEPKETEEDEATEESSEPDTEDAGDFGAE